MWGGFVSDDEGPRPVVEGAFGQAMNLEAGGDLIQMGLKGKYSRVGSKLQDLLSKQSHRGRRERGVEVADEAKEGFASIDSLGSQERGCQLINHMEPDDRSEAKAAQAIA